jgi:hypothetical protein
MRRRLLSAGPRTLRRVLLALVLAWPATGLAWPGAGLPAIQPALADDDDGGGASGGRGSGNSGRSPGAWKPGRGSIFDLFGGRSRPRQQRRVRATQPPPAYAPGEIVGLGFATAQLDQLSQAGFQVLERQGVPAFDTEAVRLSIPPGQTLETARQQAAALAPQATVDFNHYYAPNAEQACRSTDCLARIVVGWPAAQPVTQACTGAVDIGLIDTAINSDHAAFAGARIETIRLGGESARQSGRQHGTAVAALLVGSTDGRAPGLVPGGALIAVDVFSGGGRNGDRSDAFVLVRALDLLAQRDVGVINLSLSGPANLVIEQAVDRVARRGIIMVAAAGNDGPRSKPVYPAAYQQVIAVTAIDRNKRPYRRAGRGEHIDLAAPGVAVWTAASVSGARPRTGTSFAAPFITAAAALLKARDPALSPEAIHRELAESAEDLGDPGKDPVFGWGLLNARAICGERP